MAVSQPNRLALRVQATPIEWLAENYNPHTSPRDGNDAFLLSLLAERLEVSEVRAVAMLQALASIYDAAGERGHHMEFQWWELDTLDGYSTPHCDWVFTALVESRWLRPWFGGHRLWHHGRPEHVFGLYSSRKSYLDVSAGRWKALRRQIIARDGCTCRYCGGDALPACVDHVMPLFRGGKSEPDNLCVACKPCNSSKGFRTLEEWKGRE